MKERIIELIAGLEKQKEAYAKMIREFQDEDQKKFFSGKLAGLFDEIIDLNWVLTGEESKH